MRAWLSTRMPLHDERGAASVLAVALVAATLLATGILAPLCAAYAARQTAAGAADAAALAAADTASGLVPGIPCQAAGRAAELNGASLVDCDVTGLIALVQVSTTVVGMSITASARAGPP
ncbi:Rv3654c family TadE-like protein [Paramicrobacterium chengjingii]|nr:Rv3654c family TadE-like protein [Microbacterium chengjingii]